MGKEITDKPIPSWYCPICSYKTSDWMDGLDHIVKEHTQEYKATYQMTNKEYKERLAKGLLRK